MKAIFFDLDGTLCRFQGDFKKIFIDCLSPIFNSYSFSQELILELWNKHLSKEGQLTSADILRKICYELDIPLPASYLEITSLFCQTYANHIMPIQGVQDMLKTLSERYKLVLISNGPADMQNSAIDAIDIRKYFDFILISGDPTVIYRKPNPLIFQLALDKTGALSNEALMVGDNLKIDIEGAENLGLNTLFIGKNIDPRIKSTESVLSLMNLLVQPSNKISAK
jgi:putative hydrolase of the HAD superfamily